jgi:hypothetical protein
MAGTGRDQPLGCRHRVIAGVDLEVLAPIAGRTLDVSYPSTVVTQANVDVAKRWLESFDGDTEVFRGTLHPDIEWHPFEDNHTPSHGIDGTERARSPRSRGVVSGDF